MSKPQHVCGGQRTTLSSRYLSSRHGTQVVEFGSKCFLFLEPSRQPLGSSCLQLCGSQDVIHFFQGHKRAAPDPGVMM